MYLLDLTLDTPAANIALDEALLEWAESAPAEAPREVLRLWEPALPVVVVGRSSRIADEVNLPECRARGIPVLRRPSGGAAIVTGPGCLMYAVVLSCERLPELRGIDRAHAYVLSKVAEAIGPIATDVAHAGTSDLILAPRDGDYARGKKFSGNSLRVKRNHLLHHGTLLYDFDLSLISTCLRMPPRQPDYRAAREHDEFVANLTISPDQLRPALARTWNANQPLVDWPHQRTGELVQERYGQPDWNERL